jgi:hypothetical protein
LTLYDIFSPEGFPAEITEREKTAENTENFLNALCSPRAFPLCDLCGKQNERILSTEIQYHTKSLSEIDRDGQDIQDNCLEILYIPVKIKGAHSIIVIISCYLSEYYFMKKILTETT